MKKLIAALVVVGACLALYKLRAKANANLFDRESD
jgi:hypothetical protein